LLVIFGLQIVFGVDLIVQSHHAGDLATIGDLLVASILVGIGRAWELVGEWDTGLVSSIGFLIGHKPPSQGMADQVQPQASESLAEPKSTSGRE
jgi:hypothetical protein